MTKEQKADALLCAAKCWQNGSTRTGMGLEEQDSTEECCSSPDMEYLWWDEPFDAWALICASIALSEVAALGFDIVDAVTEE